jgi:hypothetical protein
MLFTATLRRAQQERSRAQMPPFICLQPPQKGSNQILHSMSGMPRPSSRPRLPHVCFNGNEKGAAPCPSLRLLHPAVIQAEAIRLPIMRRTGS